MTSKGGNLTLRTMTWDHLNWTSHVGNLSLKNYTVHFTVYQILCLCSPNSTFPHPLKNAKSNFTEPRIFHKRNLHIQQGEIVLGSYPWCSSSIQWQSLQWVLSHTTQSSISFLLYTLHYNYNKHWKCSSHYCRHNSNHFNISVEILWEWHHWLSEFLSQPVA
jgi:hypothetical protein